MTAGKCRREQPDRRKEDIGPPQGWRERRRSVERRLPEVREAEISECEFMQMFLSARQTLRESLAGDELMAPQQQPVG